VRVLVKGLAAGGLMTKVTCWTVSLLLALLLSNPLDGSCIRERQVEGKGDFDDPLEYSDLVVEGVIKDVSQTMVPYGDWYLFAKGDERNIRSLIFRLSIARVVRGEYEESEISVWAREQVARNVAVGDKVVFALFFNPDIEGGVYTVKNPDGLIREEGERWRDLEHSAALTLGEIEERVSRGRLERVIAMAEVIVTGSVESVKETPILAEDGQLKGELLKYTVNVDSVLKGGILEPTLTYFDATGSYHPEWRTWSINKPVTGERWYLCLKKAEPGYVLCAGVNSRFKIEGDRLVRFGNVPYRYSKRALDARVKEEAKTHEK
jgi:hypothetical protein